MFEKDKDYKFSFIKYRADCAKQGIQMGDWAQRCNGAKVLVKKDGSKGLIHGDVVSPGQVMMMNGIPMQIQGTKERVCFMMEPEWCEER